MKPIIVATDYSPAAKNAADYAAQLAKTTSSRLIVFHAWTLPAVTGEGMLLPVTIDNLEDDHSAAVKAEAIRLEKDWGIPVESWQSAGFAADELAACCRENNARLVVMGMEHRGGVGRLFGSVTTAFIGKKLIPVLVVPENATFSYPKTMLLATDLHTSGDWQELEMLKEIAERFGSDIHILNAVEEAHVPGVQESLSGIRLEGRLREVPHTWHFADEGDVFQAISHTATEISADWIVVIPHRHPWLQQLFHASLTKKLAFESTRPLLALPEKEKAGRD